MTIPLKVALPGFIVFWVCVATLVSFLPVYFSAVKTVDDTSVRLIDTVAARIREQAIEFFASPTRVTKHLGDVFRRELVDTTDMMHLRYMTCDVGMAKTHDITIVYVGLENGVWVACNTKDSTSVNAYLRTDALNGINIYAVDNVTYANKRAEPLTYVPGYDHRKRPWYPPLFAKPSWSPLYVDAGDAGLVAATLGFPITINGVKQGVWALDMTTTEFSRFLNSMSIGKTGYAFAFNTDLQVMATTWGASVVKEVNISGDVSREIVSFADLAPHRSIGDVADVGGLTNAMLEHNASGAVILKKETGEFYFRMGEIKDEYGLHLYFVVVIPKSDFFDEIEAERTKVIIGVVCAVVAMCIIAVVATRILLSTLERIAFRMALSAQLCDDDAADPLSSITELREMQESYEKMRGELNRIKVFLPSAVTYDAEEEEGAALEVVSDISSAASTPRNSVRHSVSTRKSRMSKHDARKSTYEVGATVAPKLNLSSGLATKNVTVMVINVRGFHDAMANVADNEWLLKAHRDLVDAVNTAVTDHKGAIDSFNGDHFVATFNATRPCAQHAKNAAIAFCHLQRTIKDVSPTFSDLSAGIATGKAMVGNLGNATMQRFCIMGAVYSQAVALEKMTASYNTAVLANVEASREIQLVVYYQYMDVVQLPHAKKAGLIATFAQLRTAKEEEWMYQIEESASSDPYTEINKAFQLLLEGDKEKARATLQALKKIDTTSFLGLEMLEKNLA